MGDSKEVVVQKYDLSGGDTVEVHKPFGHEFYVAIATMNENNYPGKGKIARNNGRTEYMLMLDGQMEFTHNGETRIVKQGESVMVGDGDTYSIIGNGRSLVFVHDEQGEKQGTTEILPKE